MRYGGDIVACTHGANDWQYNCRKHVSTVVRSTEKACCSSFHERLEGCLGSFVFGDFMVCRRGLYACVLRCVDVVRCKRFLHTYTDFCDKTPWILRVLSSFRETYCALIYENLFVHISINSLTQRGRQKVVRCCIIFPSIYVNNGIVCCLRIACLQALLSVDGNTKARLDNVARGVRSAKEFLQRMGKFVY